MNVQIVLYLTILFSIGSVFSLKCYICEGCEDFLEKIKPQVIFYGNKYESAQQQFDIECTAEKLQNIGAGLMNYTYIQYNSYAPIFTCQKVEAYYLGKKDVIRKCQFKLANNESCTRVLERIDRDKDVKEPLCSLCDTDGCNGGESVKIWLPFLVLTILLSSLLLGTA